MVEKEWLSLAGVECSATFRHCALIWWPVVLDRWPTCAHWWGL